MKDEIIDSVKKTLHERITSPFAGSFIISWLIVNWQIVLAVFSGEKYVNKVAHIEHICSAHGWTFLFFWPLGIALFYVCGYQFFLGLTQWAWTQGNNFYKKMQRGKFYTQQELDEKLRYLEKIIDDKLKSVESKQHEVEKQKMFVDFLTTDLEEERKMRRAEKNNLGERNKNLKAQNKELEKERDEAIQGKKNAEELLRKTTEQINKFREKYTNGQNKKE